MKLILSLIGILSFANLQAQDYLTPEMLWKLKRLGNAQYSPDGQHISFTQTTYDIDANKGNTDIYLYNVKSGNIKQLTDTPFSEFEIHWGVGNNIYYLSTEEKGLQIWQLNVLTNKKTRFSNFENIELEGFILSPNENFVVTIEAIDIQYELKNKYPDLPQANAKIETDLLYRHWDHWDDHKRRHIFIHDLTSNMVNNSGKDILQGEIYDGVLPPFGGTESLSISPDEKTIYYVSKKLQGKAFALSTNSDIYAYDKMSGTTKNITQANMGYDAHPKVSHNGKILTWLQMEKDGFEADKNNIIVMDLASGKKENITSSIDITVNDYCWSKDMKKMYYTAPINGTIQLFEYDFATKKNLQITEGWHDIVSLDVSETGIISGIQSMLKPVDLNILDIKTKKLKQITFANDAILSKLKKPTVRQNWVTTTDNKKMLVWEILPPDFDENKKYPTLLYCQGGPQSQVSQFFSYRWNFMLMASKGYIVVAPNRRGLPGFGQEWNNAISKDWGGQAMQDYLTAIDEASKNKYVDKDKLGAIGASYGGYSVYFLAGIHEKRFKTFISHCGLFNLESWYGTTEELFFANWDNKGPYWIPENKEYYEKNSPHRYVQNWDTPMLVIHGGNDFRVPESEGMQAFQAAQLLGLKSKFLYFPEEGHWVLKPQNGVLWHREFFEWLDSDLK